MGGGDSGSSVGNNGYCVALVWAETNPASASVSASSVGWVWTVALGSSLQGSGGGGQVDDAIPARVVQPRLCRRRLPHMDVVV